MAKSILTLIPESLREDLINEVKQMVEAEEKAKAPDPYQAAMLKREQDDNNAQMKAYQDKRKQGWITNF